MRANGDITVLAWLTIAKQHDDRPLQPIYLVLRGDAERIQRILVVFPDQHWLPALLQDGK